MRLAYSQRTLLIVILIVASALRFAALDRQSLWDDEIFTLRDVGVVSAAGAPEEAYPPLYFFLLRGWMRLTAPSPAAARAFSALWGVGGVFLIYAAGARMISPAAGLFAAALTALSPFHLAYSQEARAYTLLFALGLASVWSLWKKRRAVYLPVTVALLYTHYWGLFVWAAGAAWALRSRVMNRWTWIAAACFLPWVPELARHSGSISGAFWTPPPAAACLGETFLAFSGAWFHFGGQIFAFRNIVALAAGAALLTAGALAEDARFTRRLLAYYLALGLLLPFVTSFRLPQVFLSFRYTVAIFPAALLLAARGWQAMPRAARAAAAAALVAASAFGTAHYFTWDKGNMKAVAEEVRRLPLRDAVVIVPAYMEPLWNQYYRGPLPQVHEAGLDTLEPVLDAHHQAVMVTLDVPNPVKDALDARYRRMAEARFPGEFHLGIVVTAYQVSADYADSADSTEEKK